MKPLNTYELIEMLTYVEMRARGVVFTPEHVARMKLLEERLEAEPIDAPKKPWWRFW